MLAAWKIKKIIDSFSPDIVHAHLARAAYYTGKICNTLSTPLVVKTHNYVNLKYYQHVNKFVTTTDDQKKYLIECNIDEKIIVVIPNFSSIKAVEVLPTGDNSTLFKIISYGRMVKKKGFDVLLKAFRQVLDQGVVAKLVIGGDGPENNKLLQLSNELKLENNVVFKGWVKDVNELLNDADLFVLPSLDEPFGIAILEAMAKGVPIISTKTKGPIEILDDQTALLINVNDAGDLADKICLVAENQNACKARAERALEKFKSKYSRDSVVPQLINLYKQTSGTI
jgi:glycosyltransferase involved in cell wall biosynthesis